MYAHTCAHTHIHITYTHEVLPNSAPAGSIAEKQAMVWHVGYLEFDLIHHCQHASGAKPLSSNLLKVPAGLQTTQTSSRPTGLGTAVLSIAERSRCVIARHRSLQPAFLDAEPETDEIRHIQGCVAVDEPETESWWMWGFEAELSGEGKEGQEGAPGTDGGRAV